MSEKKNLVQSIAAFSKKFNKMDEEAKELQQPPLSKEKILQDEINRREDERAEALRLQFQDFLEPRTQDIEADEKSLLKAYELHCIIREICQEAKENGSDARLRSMEIVSPLCHRDDYTLGDQMAFLRLWFLQVVPDADCIPEFIRDENGLFYIDFSDRELWTPTSLEKEILQSLEDIPLNSSGDPQ